MSGSVVLGIDFGTSSARALLFDTESREELGSAVAAYRGGVIDERLPAGVGLPQDWALQSPNDWLDALVEAVGAVLERANVTRSAVRGIGLDFTACTVLPTTREGAPLCSLEEWATEPHAWPKLWKHHAAQAQADELTALAAKRGESWLGRYGGRISSEWLIPKAMQALDEAPAVFEAGECVVEAGDWIVWQLSGELRRNACAAGFKALWSKSDGYPSPAFLAALRPDLQDFFARQGAGAVVTPGTAVGHLTSQWAQRLGLPESTSVAAAIVDAHAGLLAAGITEPGALYMATGTSTCHLLLASSEHTVAGISGVVEDGIVSGSFAYEAGQVSAGDMLDWCCALTGRSHGELTAGAGMLRPGESGLLALDWWNGCRTPLVDADLSGAVLGATLGTSAEAMYRALLESTALGTRLVLDTFTQGGVSVDRLVVGGGLATNDLMLQIYADVTGLPVEVVSSEQPSARGAAILGAAAAGLFDSVTAAVVAATDPPARFFEPDARALEAYDELYSVYRELVAKLGASGSPLKRLSALRRRTAGQFGSSFPYSADLHKEMQR